MNQLIFIGCVGLGISGEVRMPGRTAGQRYSRAMRRAAAVARGDRVRASRKKAPSREK